MVEHPSRFTLNPSTSAPRLGMQPPNRSPAWARGIFAKDAVVSLGRREPLPSSYFPMAHARYAYACRGEPQMQQIDQGQLHSTYSGDLSSGPSSTQLCFDALLGAEALASDASIDQMRAWVSAAAPPLVYDAARARHERIPKLAARDELATRSRFKAAERAAEAPPPPLSFRSLRAVADAKLAVQNEKFDRMVARIRDKQLAIERQEAELLAAAAVESRKLKKKGIPSFR